MKQPDYSDKIKHLLGNLQGQPGPGPSGGALGLLGVVILPHVGSRDSLSPAECDFPMCNMVSPALPSPLVLGCVPFCTPD